MLLWIVLIVLVLALFGFGFALHLLWYAAAVLLVSLWYAAAVLLVLWAVGFFMRGRMGSSRSAGNHR
ncbi:hydrophobic protein [Streptomyces sp. NPDC051994]|uniref:hydrophobic protein n=1 Tax=unclassified Streptomyces TaxID=2593676 RepID=UPI00343A5064